MGGKGDSPTNKSSEQGQRLAVQIRTPLAGESRRRCKKGGRIDHMRVSALSATAATKACSAEADVVFP
jgi:hypothetical protein